MLLKELLLLELLLLAIFLVAELIVIASFLVTLAFFIVFIVVLQLLLLGAIAEAQLFQTLATNMLIHQAFTRFIIITLSELIVEVLVSYLTVNLIYVIFFVISVCIKITKVKACLVTLHPSFFVFISNLNL